MRTVAVAALALALLATPAPALSADPLLDVDARVESGKLAIDASSGDDRTVTVVVTHDDPLAGDVVDRILAMNLTADATVTATVEDARFDVDLTVRVLDGTPDLPRLPQVDLPDAAAIVRLPNLTQVD